MDLTLFRDRTYSLRDRHDLAVSFAVYGMLLVITQYLQNVRGFSPTQAGLLLLPYSVTVTLVSLRVGKLMGVVGSRRLILLGLVFQITGFAVMIAGLGLSTLVVVVGLVFCSLGSALCLTPITSLAMTAVPPERAGMASGIMSAQRALGSTVGFAVLGSVLAASLTVTLSEHLVEAIPDPAERGRSPQRSSATPTRVPTPPRSSRPADLAHRPGHRDRHPCRGRQGLRRRHPHQPRLRGSGTHSRLRSGLRLVPARQRRHRRRQARSEGARVGGGGAGEPGGRGNRLERGAGPSHRIPA